MNWDLVGIWLGAVLTLMLYSFLYRDNPFYKFAEHLFVGMSAGYWLIYTIFNVLIPNFWNELTGAGDGTPDLLMVIPGIFGLFMLARLVPKIAGLSRLALSMIVGTGAGLGLISTLQTNCLSQVECTIVPLSGVGTAGFLNNLILVAGVVCGLVYFFFSKAHKGVVGAAANIGITVLMIAFGASFGYTVMARISLLIGQAQFLIFDWLPTFSIIFGAGG
ncbi:MAG TPA: hypothetical protein PLY71_01745 [Candidatus Fermentibacter daniensis]|nr:hypothetical protein [Candidatus Fermentibacter daniensis]